MIKIELTCVEMTADPRAQFLEIALGVLNAMVRLLEPKERIVFNVAVKFKGGLGIGSRFTFEPKGKRFVEDLEGTSRRPRRP